MLAVVLVSRWRSPHDGRECQHCIFASWQRDSIAHKQLAPGAISIRTQLDNPMKAARKIPPMGSLRVQAFQSGEAGFR